MDEYERKRRALEQYLMNQPGLQVVGMGRMYTPEEVTARQQPQQAPQQGGNRLIRFAKAAAKPFWETADINRNLAQSAIATITRNEQAKNNALKQAKESYGQSIPQAVIRNVASTAGPFLGGVQKETTQRNQANTVEEILKLPESERRKRTADLGFRMTLKKAGVDPNNLSDQALRDTVARLRQPVDKSTYTPNNPISKLVLGDDKIENVPTRIRGTKEALKQGSFGEAGKKGAGLLAPLGVALSLGLDLIPGLGGTSKVAKEIAKSSDIVTVAENLVKKYPKANPDELAILANGLTSVNKPKEVKQVLKDFEKRGVASPPPQPVDDRALQKQAQQYFRANPKKALTDYQSRVQSEFGVSTPNVVSADEAKFVVPGFSAGRSAAYHESASAFAKDYYKQLLRNPNTRGQNVLITGGGAGAGKTSGLRYMDETGHRLDNYAAINDTNLTTMNSAESRIRPALESGHNVDILYVYRDPVDAFVNGNVPRAARTGRIVPIDVHVDTHVSSLETIRKVAQKYAGDSRVNIRVVDNSGGKGQAGEVPIDFLSDKRYDKDELRKVLTNELETAKAQNKVSDEAYDGYRRGFRQEPESQRTKGEVTPEVATNEPAPAPAGTPSAAADIQQADIAQIPPDVLAKIINGTPLTKADRAAVAQVPGTESVTSAIRPGEQPRGFKLNVEKNLPESPTAQAVAEALPGYKPITNQKTLGKAANEIAENPQAAYARIVTKAQLTTADDVATGNLLLRQAIEAGDIEAAIQVGTKLGIDGTTLGQAVQAYATLKRTTPEGIITFASKQAGKAGKELSPAAAKDLIEKANRIADMPESLEKAKAVRELLGTAEGLGHTWKDTLGSILSTPRAAMATADFSAPLRQGAVLGSRFPREFAKAAKDSVGWFFRPGNYERAMYEITQRPSYALMKSRKLAVQAAEDLTGTEEQFLKNILESNLAKKVGIGQVVSASNRAYTGFLTKLRADVFDRILNDGNEAGIKLGNKELDSLATYINSASGRGDGKITNLVSKANVLFSPKLWKSRIDTLNPGYYAKLDPVARKYALQSAASFASIATTVIGLAALAGADVESDPRSADWGKIKVGNTRYDVLGGHQQNIRLAAQLLTGEKINSETGEVQTLGADRGFGKPSRLDILYQFIENKENPAVAFAGKMLKGTDAAGKPYNKASEFGNLFVPLTAQGTYETAKDQGSIAKGLAMNLPGTFGIGVQTYGAKKEEKEKATTDANTRTELAKFKESKTEYGLQKLPNGKYGAKIGDDVRQFTDLTKARQAIARDQFEKSDQKSKLIGDTYFYKNKQGDVRTQPKILYDWDRANAKLTLGMDRAYDSKDFKVWTDLATEKYGALEAKKAYFDPETEADEIDKIILQQENLLQRISKYSTVGTKTAKRGTSGGGRSRAVSKAGSRATPKSRAEDTTRKRNIFSKVSAETGLRLAVPEFSTTPVRRQFKVNLPSPVSRKKSRVRIKL